MKNVLITFLIMLLSMEVFSQSSQLKSYLFDLGRFKVPISNKGGLGDVLIDTLHTGLYDGKTVMYSGGFSMTGYENSFLWLNANFPSARIEDYLPGKVGSKFTDPINSIYVINKNDPSFGESWQHYKKAVEIGASFYDGNKDGKYNPVDLNGNGRWDSHEDCPDLLGDITAWCVYNDAVPKQIRRFNWNYPEGIEIKQTIFSFYNIDILFIRYRIINRGKVSERLDSIIFSAWTDFDIGRTSYNDDLSGCDTTLDLGYTYNSGADNEFGMNAPAIGVTLLQGPPVYTPGETYFDVNGNNIYEDSIDMPIDTAIQKNGSLLKTVFNTGSKNQKMTSSSNYVVYQGLGDPIYDNRIMRCFQKGYNKDCQKINVCDWPYGTVLGNIDCNLVNPILHFSGDPVHQIGWINTLTGDQRIMVNTGEFTLHKDKPIDIWIAYVVGRGADSLNSVTKMKYNAMVAKQFYDDLPLIVHESEGPRYIPEEFRLYQNYPNPFNPITKIRYDIPKVGSRASLFVSLKVYDLLGNEVAELVNEGKSPGSYEVTFNADKLSSGVYIYRIKTLGYQRYKKMILIK